MTFRGECSSQIDAITIEGATIFGNGFSDRTLTALNNNSGVNILEQSVDVKGQFFGYNAASSDPAEVAWAIVARGSNSTLDGMFVAGD
ncbi:hypothetical protein [Yoonia sediminilitoris]|uniref:Uncharacterized protein n=1 Tax=Yoonia sediminilitoris TaxID=1286148 RepID=A0A2T6K8Y9_9RHOB|nr:hypothetical protein [Yoonia sediminilitoris]PUB11234.1 hypothetical protein C8N45_1146 [Yoonia sediminilitoris]RCW91050.1 hypothetical protein DFP92_1146 [Yoonia sediminilitoris]